VRTLLTNLERLAHTHKGLLTRVDSWLEAGRTCQQIVDRLSDKGIRIPARTLASYRQRRWAARRQRIQAQRALAEQISSAAGEEGIDAMAAALLWELLQEHKLNPTQLIAVRRVFQSRQKLDLLLKAAQPGEDADPEKVVKRMREIFGITPGP